eukprot:CAMPEP_0194148126 /NCGR_PEP_ID=MMETSP0152-20130528/30284_1 /TAXON_ID=1049557 /ORGANISM="Thalassiothrix antarctica, Strain L6-D1" /LENGTH=495 /DNA_ID=CAMNT_0038849447 /DNA_START=263 /DNA_END=1750 /DNA_ORIENTATION=-
MSAGDLDDVVESSPISINGNNKSSTKENGIFLLEIYGLIQASIIGILTGGSVGIFKLAIDALRRFTYSSLLLDHAPPFLLLPLIPAVGGAAVGLLSLLGSFPPGLQGTVAAVDELAGSKIPNFGQRSFDFLRKTLAAVCTLGTGCSLGPEGPAVEVGMAIGTTVTGFPFEGKIDAKINRSRLLLACGAAAGVSAGFNAPIAGVFFALEIVQGAFRSALGKQETIATATSSNISSILISSVLSALTAKTILGDHSVFELSDYTLRSPLVELPLFLMLGALSGLVAFTFIQSAKFSKGIFDGEEGPTPLRQFAKKVPNSTKPIIGGFFCGIVGLVFPQILFFGYETLNGLLANSSLPTDLLLALLVAKIISTAVSVGSGLVGGTFAPSLFLGGMVGASFHNAMAWLFTHMAIPGSGILQAFGAPAFELADVPAYAMVGSASVLAAIFRAPLTASLLLFELTRDYDVILPLMASAGVGSLVRDLVEQKFEQGNRVEEQ